MRRMWKAGLALATAGLGALAGPAVSGSAQAQRCEKVDESTEIVVTGVTLTHDSSFRCDDAADEGDYAISVAVTNDAGSAKAVTVDELTLSHTTPRPRGRAPEATATADVVPITVAPGETARFDVRGTYELVTTDAGRKANLHLRASNVSDEPFTLGINVHLRAAGATEEDAGPAARPELDGVPPGPAENAEPNRDEPDRSDGDEADRDRQPADIARFVEQMGAWANCVATEAPRHARASGAFDPEAACGAKPQPPGAASPQAPPRPAERPAETARRR